MTGTVFDQYVGAANETTYGTAVAPANFYEILTDSVNGSYERIESDAINGVALRSDRFAPNPKGAAGDLEFEVLDKGFDFWLEHMLGSSTTASGVTTATPGDLAGKSFTVQVGRADSADEIVPFTYAGGKVASWEISAEVDGILQLSVTCDFASETIGAGSGAFALATPTYPAGAQLMTFIGATCTVGGESFPVSSVSLTGDNALKTDRYAMRGALSTTKREPVQDSVRSYGFTLSGEFENPDQSQRIAAATAAGTLAEIVLSFDSPQGGSLEITCPAARFDEGNVNAAKNLTTQEITGVLLLPSSGAAITAVYTAASGA